MSYGFVDKAHISLKAGNGGNGAVAFHREKYVASGGPDGGDGGRGGDIIFTVDNNISTLLDFKYKRKFIAENGSDGQGKRCSGKDGKPIYVHVPRGTIIRDLETDAVMHDMSDGQDWVAVKGGRGGWGNTHFATPTRQVPSFSKPGLPGESHDVVLELKLLADVGLIGFPNVGKSTFLSVVSKAHPKIADYPFTTLFPNLGVVYVNEGNSFVMADIPGIIEGASEGEGLGYDFLRHIERCRVFVHVIDISGGPEGRDPVDDFHKINFELEKYDQSLLQRPQIVIGNKSDLLNNDSKVIESLRENVEKLGYSFFLCSAATHTGIKTVIDKCYEYLSKIPVPQPIEADYIPPQIIVDSLHDANVICEDEGFWSIEGESIKKLVSTVNFSDYESRMYFDKMLRNNGIFDQLVSMGVKDGDTIEIYDLIFEYRS